MEVYRRLDMTPLSEAQRTELEAIGRQVDSIHEFVDKGGATPALSARCQLASEVAASFTLSSRSCEPTVGVPWLPRKRFRG